MRQFITQSLEIALGCALLGFILYFIFRPLVKRNDFNFRQWLHNNTAYFCGAWIVVCLWRDFRHFTVTAYLMEVLQFVLFSLSLLHLALAGYLRLTAGIKNQNGLNNNPGEKLLRKTLSAALCFLPAAGLIALSILPVNNNECVFLYRFGTYQSAIGPGLHFRTPLITEALYADLTPYVTTVKSKDFSSPTRTADGKIIDFTISFSWSPDPQRISADYRNFFVREDSGLIYDIALGVKYFAYKGVNDAVSTFKSADITARPDPLAKKINEAVHLELQRYPITVGIVAVELYL